MSELRANVHSMAETRRALQQMQQSTVALAHTRQHAITSALDHTSTATSGKMLKADSSGLPVNATNTDVEVSGAVTHAGATGNPHGTTATQITSGTLPNAQLSANVTLQGNSFNGPSQLLQSDASSIVWAPISIGQPDKAGTGTNLDLWASSSTTTGGGGWASLSAGSGGPSGGAGGTISINAGSGIGGDSDGGSVSIAAGAKHGAGTKGFISLIGDTTVNGQFGATTVVLSLSVYANNAAAITGGLVTGQLYRTGADPDTVCVVH